jgi:multidrug efflux system membrane fusion protein
MRKLAGWGFALGAISVVVFLGRQFDSRPAEASAPLPTPAVPVVEAQVRVSNQPVVMTGIGTVIAYNSVAVHTQVTGTIQKIGFVEGQTVHPGSLIAQLDPRPYQAALQQAEANLVRDEAHLANAQANLGRYTPLLSQGFATSQQVADETAAIEELHAAIAGDEAAIGNARTQLSYTTIASPINGVTGILGIDIGNIAQPADTQPIVTITQVQPIAVQFTLPQDDVQTVQKAMAAAPLETVAYSQDQNQALGTGTLLLINNAISPTSGTAELKAIFPNTNHALWPGEFVTVHLTVALRHNAISVPLSALQQGQNGTFVYVVQPDSTAVLRPVTVLETLDGRAVIDQGLQPSETVVVAGQYCLGVDTKVVAAQAGDPQVQNQTPASQGML